MSLRQQAKRTLRERVASAIYYADGDKRADAALEEVAAHLFDLASKPDWKPEAATAIRYAAVRISDEAKS